MPSCARSVNAWPDAIAPSQPSWARSITRSRVSLPDRGAKSTPRAAPIPSPTANAETDPAHFILPLTMSSVSLAVRCPLFTIDLSSYRSFIDGKVRRKLEIELPPRKLSAAARSCMADLLIVGLDVRRRLTGRGDILRICVLQDFLGTFDFVGGITVNREKNAALLQPSFVTLRFILRNSQADERAGDSANGSSNSEPGESRHDWASRYKRTKPRDREHPYAREQTKCPAKNRTGASARCRTFGSLGRFFGRDWLRTEIIGEQSRNS